MKTYLEFHDRQMNLVKEIETDHDVSGQKWMVDADTGQIYQVSGETVVVCFTKGTVEAVKIALVPVDFGPDPKFPKHGINDHWQYDCTDGWKPVDGWKPPDGTEMPNGDPFKAPSVYFPAWR